MKGTEPKDNWLRFDGDSSTPEWDLETDCDDVDEDSYDDPESL